MHREYDAYARRIDRWDGVSIDRRTAKGPWGEFIDFDISWPGVPLAQPDPAREGHDLGSVLFFDSPEEVDEWQLRFPPIPVTGAGVEAVESSLEQVFEPIVPGDFVVGLAGRTRSYTPHLTPWNMTPEDPDPDAVLDLIHESWGAYRKWAYDRYRTG